MSIFLIGDFTASIGDPDRQVQDPPAAVAGGDRRQCGDLQEQVFKILDPEQDGDRLQQPLAGQAQFVGVDPALLPAIPWRGCWSGTTSAKRMKANLPISIHEMLYPSGPGLRFGCIEG